MPDACDRRCCCSSHAATARITHTGNACLVSSYVAGKRLEQTLAGHPRIAPSPFAPVGPPHLPLTAVVWCLYRRPAAWATPRKAEGRWCGRVGYRCASRPHGPAACSLARIRAASTIVAGGWRYWRLRVEQGASEAAQPDLSSNIVTDRCCVQV